MACSTLDGYLNSLWLHKYKVWEINRMLYKQCTYLFIRNHYLYKHTYSAHYPRFCVMFQGSWGPPRLRLSTIWRWAANSWLLGSWLKPCHTTTLPWVRWHTFTCWHLCLYSKRSSVFLCTLRKVQMTNFWAVGFAEADAKNYLTFYKRAAVFLAMGKSKSALPDLTRAIQLKPDFLAVGFHHHKCVHRAYHISLSSFTSRSISLHSCYCRPGCREGTSF